jgi:hypothetical protein
MGNVASLDCTEASNIYFPSLESNHSFSVVQLVASLVTMLTALYHLPECHKPWHIYCFCQSVNFLVPSSSLHESPVQMMQLSGRKTVKLQNWQTRTLWRVIYNETPEQCHPHLKPMKVCEHKFAIVHFVALSLSSIHRHEVQ